MKRLLMAAALTLSLFSCDTLSNVTGPVAITEAEAAQGMRQALEIGLDKGVNLLNREDGFFGNSTYKLLLPEEALRIENTLRQLGMGALADRAILQINRAAENALGAARPIFAEALRGMTINDAINIIRGGRNAATQYFRDKTGAQLVTAFTPIIKSSLDQFSATKYYGDMVDTYNGFPTTLKKLNPDLTSYVVGKAVDALFDQVAKEEANIRTNAAARTSEVLKRVFGWAARQG